MTDPVDVWRAVPAYAEDQLRPGDLVSTSRDVGHYAPRGKVIHARVRPEELEYHQRARPGEVELRYVGTRPRGRVVERFSNPLPFSVLDRQAAIDRLYSPISEWLHRPSAGKRAVAEVYASLTDRQRAALDADVRRAFVAAHGAEHTTAYRYRAPSSSDWGLVSVSTVEPTYLAPDRYRAVDVVASQVLAHWNQPDLPLGGRAFGHEREVILKPGVTVS